MKIDKIELEIVFKLIEMLEVGLHQLVNGINITKSFMIYIYIYYIYSSYC